MAMAALLPYLPALISAGSSLASGFLSPSQQQTPIQGQQRELIDELLRSLKGNGQFSDLFSGSEDAFQRSFVDPAKQLFNSQIAPQIEQNYISSGQQRGTGLQDTLSRAGIDLDQMLNQNYMQMLQNQQRNQQNVIGNILGMGSGVPEQQSTGNRFLQSLGGYLGSKSGPRDIASILGQFSDNPGEFMDTFKEFRKGFES